MNTPQSIVAAPAQTLRNVFNLLLGTTLLVVLCMLPAGLGALPRLAGFIGALFAA